MSQFNLNISLAKTTKSTDHVKPHVSTQHVKRVILNKKTSLRAESVQKMTSIVYEDLVDVSSEKSAPELNTLVYQKRGYVSVGPLFYN